MGNPEFLNSLASLKTRHKGCVVTIGSFDGVHRGHQRVLAQLVAKSRELNLPSLVMVFEPQPNEYFAEGMPPPRLMRLREKVCALFEQGIDRVLCLRFNEALRSLTASEYIQQVLVDGLSVKHLVIGDDFKFGCDRSGDFAMLCEAGKANGFSVVDTQTCQEDAERISSTRIRALVEAGDLNGAQALLGRPYRVMGRVGYGKQLGRTLGFPTLNISLGPYRTALSGVYAVQVTLANEPNKQWQGVANVGVRPTVNATVKPVLEVHLLNSQVSLYGQRVHVSFVKKVREEKRFDSVDELQEQIASDVEATKHIFNIDD